MRALWRSKVIGSAWVRVHLTVAFSFTFTELCCTDSSTPADASEMKEKTTLRNFSVQRARTFREGDSQKLFTPVHGDDRWRKAE
jgi:hypothetical protein